MEDDKEFQQATEKQAPSKPVSIATGMVDQIGRLFSMVKWVEGRMGTRLFILAVLALLGISIIVVQQWATYYFSADNQILTSAEDAPMVDSFTQVYEVSLSEDTKAFLKQLLSP